jgi:competence protein ComEC
MLPQIPVVSKVLAYVLEKSIIFMNKVLAIIEHTPFASMGKIWLTTGEYLLAYVIIICLFYFLFDRKKWLLKLSMAAVLLLCMSMSFKRINAFDNDHIALLNLKKHTGLVFKSGNQAIVLSDIKADDKNYQYSIQPYLDSNKVSNAILVNIKDDVTIPFFVKRSNLVQFKNKLFLIFNSRLQNQSLPRKLKVDYIYVTGNPHTTIDTINKNYDYQTLIIDGSNTDRLTKNLVSQAKIRHIDYQLLKRNKSLIIASN